MKILSQLSVRSKLLGAFVLVCGCLAAVCTYELWQVSSVNGKLDAVFKQNLQPISAISRAQIALAEVRRNIATVFILEGSKPIEDTKRAISTAEEAFDRYFLVATAENSAHLELSALDQELRETVPQYLDEIKSAIVDVENADAQAAKDKWLAARQLAIKVYECVDKLVTLNENLASQAKEASTAAYHTTFRLVVGLIVGITALSLTIGWLMARWVSNAVLEVAEISDELASASLQLANAAEELSTGAQEQASSLEETASCLEEITSTAQSNAANAQQANQLAGNSRQTAESGGEVVSRAVQGMDEINAASKRIADIITAIDEIAFQTNLLALNAAVEAARAGEQGRGFAVVAGEVRNLAQRSSAAAKEIKSLIHDSVSRVANGSELVNESGRTLREIMTSVKRVTDIVSEIADASREQATGIEQVNEAVTRMDKVVQSNAAQTEELSATAEQLSVKAKQMQEVVIQFNLMRKNTNASPESTSPSQLNSSLCSSQGTARSRPVFEASFY